MENELKLGRNVTYDVEFKYIEDINNFRITVCDKTVNIDTDEARQIVAFVNNKICYIPDKNTISALAYCDKQGLGGDGGSLMRGALWLRELIEKRLGSKLKAPMFRSNSAREKDIRIFNLENELKKSKDESCKYKSLYHLAIRIKF